MTEQVKMDQLIKGVNEASDWYERDCKQVRAVPVDAVYRIVAAEVARGATAAQQRADEIVQEIPREVG
ncbi:hypothetical protein [Saccharopolyspora sp. SCSIO 74807]|uniref:hypothetical protein n=1 Tax=Saccharopolyspora sp. SCSIO 74807 TaxID=3118084 RepID=UPI0030CACFC2